MKNERKIRMNVVIYGANYSGLKALEICENMGFNVIAFIDRDVTLSGKKIKNILIYDLNQQSEKLLKDNVVIMGTNSKEAYNYVKNITDKIIEIDIVHKLFATYGKIDMPNTELDYEHMENCKLIPNRLELLKYLPQNGIIAEVGVFKGEFSQKILEICKPKKLFLIDLWEGEEKGITGPDCFKLVKEKFKRNIEAGQVELIKMDSVTALKQFENYYFDWIYLDTVHDYITPHNELEIAKYKVKENGFICGHDYTKVNEYRMFKIGVWNAVNEFVKNYKYEFKYITFEDNGLQSYAIKKH